jgi:cytochrome bd-type quinol oxidase subunit 2
MDLSSFYNQYSWVAQLLLFAVVGYYYFKNRNKKVDEEKALWYRTAMLTIMVLVMMVSCVLAIVCYDDPSHFSRMHWPIVGSSVALLILTSIFIEYKFRHKKKLLNNPPELNKEHTL